MRKKWIFLSIVSCVLVISIFTTAIIVDRDSKYDGFISNQGSMSLSLFKVEDVCLVNSIINEWFNSEDCSIDTVESLYEQYREYGRLDYPVPVTIKFMLNNVNQEVKIEKKYLEISEDRDFQDFITIYIENHKNEVDVYNLKADTEYFYRVVIELSNDERICEESSFETLKTPRYCYVDGVRNVRDIGGYFTDDGKIVKQGLIYRGTELDGAISEGKFVITQDGIDTMQNVLKIRHQMDLRASNLENAKDSLPSNISHTKYTAFSYSETFGDHGVKALKKIFVDLADENNYPMYVHCTYGNDRTGTIIYLMGAVLGIDEASLYKEWALSMFFSGSSGFKVEMDEFLKTIDSFEGDTLQEKVSGYLISIGITQEQIDSFKNIMLESK